MAAIMNRDMIMKRFKTASRVADGTDWQKGRRKAQCFVGLHTGRRKARFLVACAIIAFAVVLAGCHDKTPPVIPEETVDLADDSLNGQWDVQLEIWQSGDRTNVYKSHLRFNVTMNPEGVYDFSVYRVKEGTSPERFSGLPGFQPEYVDSMGQISVESSDMIYIWFDSHPEYQFRTYLERGQDGKMVGSGNALSLDEEGETLATLQITQTRKW